MELRQIRYFLSVAETEHLTQSAEALFITQSTLSHGLRQLETELGTPLFDERMHLVVHESHPLAKRRTMRMSELAQVPLALLPDSFATRRMIDGAFALAQIKPLVRVEMESVDALLLACRQAPLATIAAEHAALNAGDDMRAILLNEPRTVRRAGVLWRKGASRSAAAREFVALLRPAVQRAAIRNAARYAGGE